MDLQHTQFDQLVQEFDATFNSAFALDFAKAQVEVSDLIQLVQTSKVVGKEELALSLERFITDANAARQRFSTLGSQFDGALDKIVAVNERGMCMIIDAHARNQAKEPNVGSAFLDQVTRRTFCQSMDVLASQLKLLMVEVEANHENLSNLEAILVGIRDIALQNETPLWLLNDLVSWLAKLWIKFGWDTGKMQRFEKHWGMLTEVTVYRKPHVLGMLKALADMNDGMEEIWNRVWKEDSATGRIEPEMHMMSIRLSMDRLEESRMTIKRIGDEEKTKDFGSDWRRHVGAIWDRRP
ncbi:hypothetical protein FA15DRAFT_131488 [Coprinopsis marcescibilis]|uniref:Uncharacterized protein n=1 Tax=Coprinopsis marcescibilis TaxID=230819 RepID=A0A5C3L4Z8_COPMA|nr:hypothetical protein FA15DRAFT_131488 [Coprinopsis marcescibilis]